MGDAFPRCRAATTVAGACQGLVDDLAADGRLPSVYLLVDSRLRCQAARGYFQVVDGFTTETGVIGRSVRTGRTVVVDDVTADPDFVAAVPGLRGEVCVPVEVGGAVVGAVNLETYTRLPPEAVDAAVAGARVLGEVIERCGGLPAVPIAQRLARAAVSMSSQQDTRAIQQLAVEAATDISGMSSAALSTVVDAGRWAVWAATGPLAESLRAWNDDDHETVAGWVGAGTSSHFPGDGEVPPEYEFLHRAGVRAVSVQPLVAGGAVTGLLTTADAEPRRHDPEVVVALELLATQAACCLGMAVLVDRLNERATRDPLTGLRNGASFTDDLTQAAVSALKTGRVEVACLLIDLDEFKAVNDSQGHLAGDQVLRQMAAALQRHLRPEDTLYRIGGDELAALVRTRDPADVEEVARRLGAAARTTPCTVSIGAAMVADVPERVREAADAALYAAKEAGRDAYRLAT